ncbi:MAG: hypothetical protein A2328_09925 [Bdellovibrionales bacterium RIFOXYB2_FULL_36_6]|nr:MAG: hypothetical protein A2328_09925 [Bdellovibrionales bacterium RIFOXYB2_FULL_36_6]
MLKIIITFLLTITALSINAREISFIKMIDEYAKNYKLSYSISPGVKDFEITLRGRKIDKQEDVFKIITTMGALNGLGVAVDKSGGYFKILSGKDMREEDLSILTDEKLIPDNYQYIRFIYNIRYLDSREIVRGLRPLMSRYGRIRDDGIGNKVVMIDTAKNILKILNVIKTLDIPETRKYAEELHEFNEEFQKLSESREGFLNVLAKQHALFIILFSLIFLIIGFMIRGYMI